MSILRIEKGKLPSSVNIPPSKSYANRALILSCVHKGTSILKNVPEATDVTHLISALSDIGLIIRKEKQTTVIENSFPECETKDVEVYVGEGGTTARFLSALVLLGRKKYILRLGKRLKLRPWEEFLETARSLGCEASLEDDALHLRGPLQAPARLEIDCSRTTQFATAFDLVLENTRVLPTNLHTSESYWKMNAPLKDHFSSFDSYLVPGDWSSAAFPMTFAALNHEIHFPELKEDKLQADSKILDVLNKLGSVKLNATGLTVSPVISHQSITMDMSDCLDLFPALTFLLAHVKGTHLLTGLGNLAHKESDRLEEMEKILKAFGRDYKTENNSLMIHGKEELSGEVSLELPDDHRIVMAAALFLRHHNGGSLTNAESVKKSYPEFFNLLQ